MKAIVLERYGPPDVLHIEEVEKPVPKDNEILIRTRAASIGFGDTLARNFKDVTPRKFSMPFPLWLFAKMYFGFKKPKIKILGSEFAGDVEAVGKNVTRFKKGEQVFGYLGQRMGAYAEFLRMPEKGCVAVKPASLSYEEAAVIPYGAIMAVSLLKKGKLQAGRKVLINGASGGIGAAAVQLAKALYGAEVTGVCGAPRIEYVKALGAGQVLDYAREDFTKSGERYDLIFDVLGKSRFSQCKGSLKPKGRYLLASFKSGRLLQMFRTSLFGGKKVVCAFAPEKAEALLAVKELIEAGKFKAIVDRSFPMEKAAEAHAYVEQGQKKGPVVLTFRAGR